VCVSGKSDYATTHQTCAATQVMRGQQIYIGAWGGDSVRITTSEACKHSSSTPSADWLCLYRNTACAEGIGVLRTVTQLVWRG
jgi:hypothetical protein